MQRILRSQTKQVAETEDTTPPTKVTKRRRSRAADPWAKRRKPSTNSKPPKPQLTHFTCRICIEEQTTDQFVTWMPPKRRTSTPSFDIPSACIDHLARNPRRTKIDPVCKTCIGNFLSARIDTLGAQNISTGCLEPGCTNFWHNDYIMQHIPAGEPLNKFNMEMLEVWKQTADPGPLTCIAPDCNSVGLPDLTAPGYPQVVCNECSTRSCAQCLVPWHKDLTCPEYAAKHVNEKMSDTEKETLELMQSKDGRRCPNCQLVIVKDGGCDSMLCVGCYKYFNWATAASAVSGAKKAQVPLIHGIPHWQDPEPAVTCEMDGLLASGNTTKSATS
ncbi:RING-U-box [Pyrenophora teres f. maculata]|nr:RING-U-box [Pyrenophora teres f. maculata]